MGITDYFRIDECIDYDLEVRTSKQIIFFERYNFHDRNEDEAQEDIRTYNDSLRNIFHIIHGSINIYFLLKSYSEESHLIKIVKDVVPDIKALKGIVKAHRNNSYKYQDSLEGSIYIRRKDYQNLASKNIKHTSERFEEIIAFQFQAKILSPPMRYISHLISVIDSETFQALNGKKQKEILRFLQTRVNPACYELDDDAAFEAAKQLFNKEYFCSTGRPKNKKAMERLTKNFRDKMVSFEN